MATLNIRNLPEPVHRALRLRAARSGRSMEAEARAILTQACVAESQPLHEFQTWVDELYGGERPPDVVHQFIQERRAEFERET